MSNDTRPDIGTIRTGEELRRWYWLKAELEAHARTLGVRASGAKFTILDRIAHFLDTGETAWPGDRPANVVSRVDWQTAPLDDDTIITDSYRNTQNVRRYFCARLGEGFKFDTVFMAWMKANTGKTLADALNEHRRLSRERAEPDFRSTIAAGNQFNQYTRDFLADNPDAGMEKVRRIWALKRARPSKDGRHVYQRADLDLE